MASNVIAVPPTDFPLGIAIFGPVLTGIGHNGFELKLDLTGAVLPVTMQMQYAADGVHMVTLSTEGPMTVASAVNRDGTPAVPPLTDWAPDIGEFGGVDNLTTAISKVQIVVDSAAAWHSPGGTLTVF